MFYGTFWPTRVVFGPFLDVFWTVHFIMIFVIVGFVSLAGACQSEVPVFEVLFFVGVVGVFVG